MTIFINDQEIDFTLEGGEKALEIYESLRTFLQDSGYYIYAFSIDGNLRKLQGCLCATLEGLASKSNH